MHASSSTCVASSSRCRYPTTPSHPSSSRVSTRCCFTLLGCEREGRQGDAPIVLRAASILTSPGAPRDRRDGSNAPRSGASAVDDGHPTRQVRLTHPVVLRPDRSRSDMREKPRPLLHGGGKSDFARPDRATHATDWLICAVPS